jgi:hypothetical protein
MQEKLPFLGVNMDNDQAAAEYEIMKNTVDDKDTDTSTDVSLDDFCAWYSKSKVPPEVAEEASKAEEKAKNKEEKRANKRQKKQEKAAALALLEQASAEGLMQHGPGVLEMDMNNDGAKDTLVLVDTDGDGKADMAMVDSNGDGNLDMIVTLPGEEGVHLTDDQIRLKEAKAKEEAALQATKDEAEMKLQSAQAKGKAELAEALARKAMALEASKIVPQYIDIDGDGIKDAIAMMDNDGDGIADAVDHDGDGKADAMMMTKFRKSIIQFKTDHPDNLISKFWSEALYAEMKANEKAELEKVIAPGIALPHLDIGCFAGAADHYDTFAQFFDPLIRHLAGVGAEVEHASNSAIASDVLDLSEVELNIVSVGVESRRNIKGFKFSGALDASERVQLEQMLSPTFDMFKELPDFGGRYYSMTPGHPNYIDAAAWAALRTADGERAMPKDITKLEDDANSELREEWGARIILGVGADYPQGRGCYMSDNGETVIWVGGDDHIRVVCVKEGKAAALSDVLDNLRLILDLYSGDPAVEFAESAKYGVVTVSPENVGTGMRAFANVQTPLLLSTGIHSVKLSAPAGVKVRQRDVDDYSAASPSAPVTERCEVYVTSKFGTSEAQTAKDLLNGLHVLARKEMKMADEAGIPRLIIEHTPSEMEKVQGAGADKKDGTGAAGGKAAADGAGGEAEDTVGSPIPGADGTHLGGSRMSIRRDSLQAESSARPLTWEELESNICGVADTPEILEGFWNKMNLGDQPAKIEDMKGLLLEIDLRLGHSVEAISRAFTNIVDHEAPAISVERQDLYPVIAGTFYFAKMFSLFPDTETNREKKLDLVEYKEAVGKLTWEDEMPPTNLAAQFDSMESNDGGLIQFDDFVVWYIAIRCPRGVRGLEGPPQ